MGIGLRTTMQIGWELAVQDQRVRSESASAF
jgi:hypothetical protein